MYLDTFGLRARPFPVSPDIDAFFAGGSRKELCDALRAALDDDGGIVKVTGEVGSGKTTLARHLVNTLPVDRFVAILLADPSLTREQMLYAVAEGLEMPAVRTDPELLLVRLKRRLAEIHGSGRRVLLLVDEAHAMPEGTLDQVRLLAQIDAGDRKIMPVVILGPEELDQNLALPELRAVRERIVHSFRLRRLAGHEIDDYLTFKLRAFGWNGARLFSSNAVRTIRRLSGGNLRRINLLADRSLAAIAKDRRDLVQSTDIDAAARAIRFERRRVSADAWVIGTSAFVAGAAIAVAALSFALSQGWVHIRTPNEVSSSAGSEVRVTSPAIPPGAATATVPVR